MEEKKDWKEELQDIINREMFKEDLMIQIKSLVEQELDKAREEGFKKGYRQAENKWNPPEIGMYGKDFVDGGEVQEKSKLKQ